jgi:hypothetical protein
LFYFASVFVLLCRPLNAPHQIFRFFRRIPSDAGGSRGLRLASKAGARAIYMDADRR